ncbi:MAG: hypothetical protein AB8B69_09735, partial [Chitinophagales bacterium]
MKRYLLQIIALTVTLTMISCEDFLNREPLDQLTTDNFYKTLADADKALLATYSPMQDQEWNSKGWMLTEIPSDNTQPGGTDPDFTPIDNFT